MNNGIDKQVISFVAKFVGCNPAELIYDTSLFGDLGLDGDDGKELIEAFAKQFKVDITECKTTNYFGPEGLPFSAPFGWIIQCLRKGSVEERARLKKITIEDLIRTAKKQKWEKNA